MPTSSRSPKSQRVQREITPPKNGRPMVENLLVSALAFHLRRNTANDAAVAARLGISLKTLLEKYRGALDEHRGGFSHHPEDTLELDHLGREALGILQGVVALLEKKTVRVAMTSHISSNYFVRLVRRVKEVGPEIRLVALDCRADALRDLITTGEADLAFGPVYSEEMLKHLEGRANHCEFALLGGDSRLFDSKFILVRAKGDAGKRLAPTSPDWVREQSWVLHERGTATRLVIDREFFGGLTKTAKVEAESSDAMQLVELAREGVGHTIVASGPSIERFIAEHGLVAHELPMAGAPETKVAVYGKVDRRAREKPRTALITTVATAAVEVLSAFFDPRRGSGSARTR